MSLRYFSFKHNRGHSWVMLPITVDFLFDGRNTVQEYKDWNMCARKNLHIQVLKENVFGRLNTRETCDSWNANKGTNQCSSDMNNYCQWHKMADVRSVENRKRRFHFDARMLFCLKFWCILVHDYSAFMYRTEMRFVEMFFIHLPGETSAFLAILYYLWMFICCSIGVPPWNRPRLRSTTLRFHSFFGWCIVSNNPISRGHVVNDHFRCKFRSPWLRSIQFIRSNDHWCQLSADADVATKNKTLTIQDAWKYDVFCLIIHELDNALQSLGTSGETIATLVF